MSTNRFADRIRALRVVAVDPAEEAERQAFEVRQRVELLSEIANQRNVPRHAGLRRACVTADSVLTDSVRLCSEAMAWRAARCSSLGLEPVLRVVAGATGTGKSSGVAHALVRHRQAGLFVPAATVASTPRNSFSDNTRLWEAWLSVDMLAVDDMGCEDGDPGLIHTLLEQRHNSGFATLGTTNLLQADFAERYRFDERQVDRFVRGQPGLSWFVIAKGPSLRGAK